MFAEIKVQTIFKYLKSHYRNSIRLLDILELSIVSERNTS